MKLVRKTASEASPPAKKEKDKEKDKDREKDKEKEGKTTASKKVSLLARVPKLNRGYYMAARRYGISCVL